MHSFVILATGKSSWKSVWNTGVVSMHRVLGYIEAKVIGAMSSAGELSNSVVSRWKCRKCVEVPSASSN